MRFLPLVVRRYIWGIVGDFVNFSFALEEQMKEAIKQREQMKAKR